MKRGDTLIRCLYDRPDDGTRHATFWVWVEYAGGAGCPLQVHHKLQVTSDGVDWWLGGEQLTGICRDRKSVYRSAIVRVRETTQAELERYFDRHQLIVLDSCRAPEIALDDLQDDDEPVVRDKRPTRQEAMAGLMAGVLEAATL